MQLIVVHGPGRNCYVHLGFLLTLVSYWCRNMCSFASPAGDDLGPGHLSGHDLTHRRPGQQHLRWPGFCGEYPKSYFFRPYQWQCGATVLAVKVSAGSHVGGFHEFSKNGNPAQWLQYFPRDAWGRLLQFILRNYKKDFPSSRTGLWKCVIERRRITKKEKL